jgi:hypothetical protein
LLCLSCGLFHSSTLADFPLSSIFNPNPYFGFNFVADSSASWSNNIFIVL